LNDLKHFLLPLSSVGNIKMKTLNNAVLVALTAASMIVTGCGDFPDATEHQDNVENGVNMGAHSLGSADGLSAQDILNTELTETARIDRLYPELDDGPNTEEPPVEAWDDTANEPVVLPIYTEIDDEDDFEVPAPMPAGFADGCATHEEWERLANAVCDSFDASIARLTLGDSCGQQQYRVTNFGCMIGGDHKSETTYREFTSVLLGDATSCKTMADYRTTADHICGTAASLIEVKGLAECDVEESEETHYTAVRITCTDMD
jgi:hypothetical protein